jgi:hypothetical protein
MKPLIKLLGAIALVITSGSVLAIEGNIFSVIALPESADGMLLCGLAIMAAIARRRHISLRLGVGGYPVTERVPLRS